MTRPKRRLAPLLLVEDDPDTRDAIKSFLEFDGYGVTTAVDGADALGKLRSGLRPCLILLDLMMPGMDGFQFRSEQVRDPMLASIPVVVYSGYHDVKPQAALLGAAAYIRKPIDFAALLKLIERHCVRHAPAAALPKAHRHHDHPLRVIHRRTAES